MVIKVTIKNVGICTWPRGSSFVCVPEYSTLLCEEYIILDDDVIPGYEITINLEFLKKMKKNIINLILLLFDYIYILNFLILCYY